MLTSSYRPVPGRARLALVGAAVLALSACGGGSSSSSADAVTVDASDTACQVGQTELPAGGTTLAISNTGSSVTEVYVYEGDRVVTEKENIGPGTSYDLTVDLPAGSYEVACKPGMQGDGIRTPITVTAS